MRIHHASLLLLASLCYHFANSQDSLTLHGKSSQRFVIGINKQLGEANRRFEKSIDRNVSTWERREQRLLRRLTRQDASGTNLSLQGKIAYNQLKSRLTSAGGSTSYFGSLDSLNMSLRLLGETHNDPGTLNAPAIQAASARLDALRVNLNKADEVKTFLNERRQWLRERLANSGLAKKIRAFDKQRHYCEEQFNEYKEALKDHRKLVHRGLQELAKSRSFQQFFHRNSQFASMFRMPEDPNDPFSQASLVGLQTRAMVNGIIQQQLAAGGPGAATQFRQNMQQAQSELEALKNKYMQGKGDLEMPTHFKPNSQKTKPLLQRFEYSVNVQSQRARSILPTTSDLGLSLGYKMNDKSIVGIGATYKMGWGKDIRHISLSHQGVGFRSFIDWKLKGSVWLTGGYELNHFSAFKHFDELKDRDAWQPSGLIGITKTVSIRAKFFKNTKLQLLWDFLRKQRDAAGAPVVFRVGYTF